MFGAYARGEDRPGSDIDLLVEFEPGHVPGLLDIVGMQQELTDLAETDVDLHLPTELSEYIRDRVLHEARPIYGG